MAAASNHFGNTGNLRELRLPALLALLALVAVLLPACKPGDDTHSGVTGVGGQGGGGGSGGGGGAAPCESGTTRDCHVELGTHGNVVSCFSGTQTCNDGVWGACEGEQADHPPPPPPPATPCVGNSCDPACQSFDEAPGTPIGSPPQNLIAPWLVGSYGGLPAALKAKVSGEPCGDGSACQVDQYCNNPASGNCSHNKCVTGGGLLASCDPSCVSKICTMNAACCTTPVGSCSHDLCATGVALAKGVGACDPCVNTVCSGPTYNFCCDTATGAWTAECVDRVVTACSKVCATGSWSQTCVDLVDSSCNAKCLADKTPPLCAHDKCLLGDALDAACDDPCVAKVCMKDATCCTSGTGAWTGQCLQYVATECGLTCPAKGDCVPWLPQETDPKCPGTFDLTIGVGCTSGAVQKVPVCNRGLTASPAGLILAIFPAVPNVIPQSGPSLATATTISVPAVPSGKCVDVNLPAGTAEDAQLIVNPTTDPNYASDGGSNECHNNNNWGVWSSATGACGTPSCAGASAFAKLKKIKLFFSVDVSGSMGRSVVNPAVFAAPTRWDALKTALGGFMSAAPDDTGVWIRFWPNNDLVAGPCPGPASVFSAGCAPVPFCKIGNADVNDLTAANETLVVNAINAVGLTGNTPMFPALDAATQKAVEFQQANADWNAVVILVTDGNPLGCITTPSKIAALAGAAYNGYGVRTYTVGLTTDVNKTTVDLIAGTGGGRSFFVNTNNNAQFQSDLVSALNQIKQDFVSCTLPLPSQGSFDPAAAVITYTPGVGMPIVLPKVANGAGCVGDGWYYDDPVNPKSITLCPTTCSNVKLDTNGKLEMNVGCIQQYLPSTYSQVYTASCPVKGTVIQWGFLGYNATTPGDSRIDFRVQTSDDNMTYSALQPSPIKTAQASPNTQVCPMGGPSPCPVNLFDALNGPPDAHRKYLKLVANIFPTSDTNQTPTINNWQIWYSCPDAE